MILSSDLAASPRTEQGCWRQPGLGAGDAAAPKSESDASALLKEIIGNLQAASENAILLMKRAVALLAERREMLEESPAHHALKMAIWSDKSQIDPAEVQRLAPLWVKYFEAAPPQARPELLE